jgi:hypothetical protein
VDISTALSLDLKNLLRVLDLPDLDIERSLRALRYDVAVVVPSFVGLSMTVVVEEQAVTLTSMGDEALKTLIGSSLRLPLSLTSGLSAGSELVLYALTPGAFVDLAADLAYATDAVAGDVVVDGHLTPVSRRSGLVGVEELAMINRAVGLLMGRGLSPEAARAQLQHRAGEKQQRVFQVAACLLALSE